VSGKRKAARRLVGLGERGAQEDSGNGYGRGKRVTHRIELPE
jgi:hypothetical protein